MVQVVWSQRALSDLRAIRAYVRQFAPKAADSLALRLVEAADSLSMNPDRGRPLPRSRRELVSVRPYLIRYRSIPDAVEILSIRHGARRPLP